MPANDDLASRFMYHPPITAYRKDVHEQIRERCLFLARFLNSAVPDGREKSLAVTKLEEVMFWANAGLARQEQ